ncbi:MAG: RNA-binding S4 domain-containing protein [Thiocapsa sp.]|jgi:ribosome-associated heat shock protein Hsp15|nr:S4 domain-containing protein [Thiocapsa sp.]MCG6897062.1 RNA-binding S4 domain-containing protein [Thiocapsa sp.]
MTGEAATHESIRLDKWLWAARFFRTRQLAVEAISGGKVQVNGHRAKPGRAIGPGARILIRKGGLTWEVEVIALTKQRRSPSDAALLYLEDEASRVRRRELVRERRETGAETVEHAGRPTKRDRRLIQRFKSHSEPGS